nr:carboxyl transferase domain-containing protein [Pseudarthrobacter psychrotolerans]
MVIGHTRDTAVDPAGLRLAQRGMELAEQLRLPLLSLIDTVGAELSVAAEESSMAGEIARSIARLISLRTSTISLILGQGTGGGALALLPADRMIAAQHAWLAPLAPEGASAILYKRTSEANRTAQDQGITAADLHAGGIIDRVLPDPVDAAPDALIRQVSAAIVEELNALTRSKAANRPGPEIGRRERLSRLGNAVVPV